jgi:hypothetical protein
MQSGCSQYFTWTVSAFIRVYERECTVQASLLTLSANAPSFELKERRASDAYTNDCTIDSACRARSCCHSEHRPGD